MKTKRYPTLRALPLFALASVLFCATANGQSAFPSDPHDPNAYTAGAFSKSTATPGRLLSKVNYTSRQDTLSGYDSTRITYAAGGSRITELMTYRWDAGTWRAHDRFTYRFNGSGLNDQTIYEFWDPIRNTFFPVSRYNYMHDASGKKSQLMYEVWNVGSATYKNGLMEYYSYGSGTPVTGIHQQIWSVTTSAWENSSLESMSFNAQGSQESYTIQTWNFSLATWENKRQTLSSYDGSGKVLSKAENFTWGGTTPAWRYKSRTLNSIAGGKITQQTIDNYDLVKSAWVPYTKETMSYLSTGTLGSSVMAAWVPASGNYADQSRATYTYNSDDQPKRVLTLVRAHGSWAVTSGAGETIYYYEGEKPPLQLSAGTIGSQTPSLTVFPAPASGSLNVQLSKAGNDPYDVMLCDMGGRVVVRQQARFSGSAPVSIDVQTLPAGLYSLSLTSPQSTRVSKLVSIVR